MTASELPSATRSAIGILELAHVGLRNAQRIGADDFDLAHRNAAGDLGAVFGERGDEEQLLELAEAAFARHAARPAVHLAQALDGGREPGEAVRRVLGVVDAAALPGS